jgi:hypothetical protein
MSVYADMLFSRLASLLSSFLDRRFRSWLGLSHLLSIYFQYLFFDGTVREAIMVFRTTAPTRSHRNIPTLCGKKLRYHCHILAARIPTSCIAYGFGLPPFAFRSWCWQLLCFCFFFWHVCTRPMYQEDEDGRIELQSLDNGRAVVL